ncbi:sigma-70 family RNA polymerase sigma factor [Sphingomicrobium sediminis]|uniref:Sigma-70 family RNA polymerase sigma factor n=1 Tax=Sphingomicrobium sediminis TaxID=2950949 RepID=A0A9X2EKS4_9SPHN|nr:sigma-70 family RNA polymerase sigma factor [Sphingomicrobium sediminis]MCM8557419.1 sigma-70 family RNA polymerase sigma factor [Sphingomicrobium sediminis]
MSRAPRRSTPEERAALESALVATGEEDRSAFSTLYRLTSAKLFGICLRICGSKAAAEDVMSDVYLTIWKRAGAYQPGRASPISWLATIARNRAIDWRRAAANRPMADIDDVVEPASDTPAADDMIAESQRDAALEECLRGLGDDQQRAVRTAFFGGLTYAELADKEGIPLGTMKSRMRRALIALKSCMEGKE